jgi:Mn2+/Fe2+ NRAMP family transporter
MARLSSRFRNHILIFLAVIGPGFITAMVDNDSGGIYTYSKQAHARSRSRLTS